MDSILSNNTWVLVDLPPGSKLIGCKWVFRRKYNTMDSLLKYLSTYQIFIDKSSYKRDMMFLRQPINFTGRQVFVKKQVQFISKASKPTCKLFICMEKVFNWTS